MGKYAQATGVSVEKSRADSRTPVPSHRFRNDANRLVHLRYRASGRFALLPAKVVDLDLYVCNTSTQTCELSASIDSNVEGFDVSLSPGEHTISIVHEASFVACDGGTAEPVALVYDVLEAE